MAAEHRPPQEILAMLLSDNHVLVSTKNTRMSFDDMTDGVGGQTLQILGTDIETTKALATAVLQLYDYGLSHPIQSQLIAKMQSDTAKLPAMHAKRDAEKEKKNAFAKKAQEFDAIDNDTIRELKTQKRLISVDIAGARARIAACEKLLPSSRLRGPKAIEQVESIKITAEIDLVDLTAREEAIAKIIDEGTEHKRLIGHSRMRASYYSTESEYIRRAIAAIKELDAKRKLNMPVSVNNNTI